MSSRWLQAQDRVAGTAAFNSTDVLTCRITVPYAHKLEEAFLFVENTVLTGDLEIFLMRVDPNDARTAAEIGVKLENADINEGVAISAKHVKIDILLGDDDKGVAPANRQYLLKLTSTNSADRFEEPQLMIKVNDRL